MELHQGHRDRRVATGGLAAAAALGSASTTASAMSSNPGASTRVRSSTASPPTPEAITRTTSAGKSWNAATPGYSRQRRVGGTGPPHEVILMHRGSAGRDRPRGPSCAECRRLRGEHVPELPRPSRALTGNRHRLPFFVKSEGSLRLRHFFLDLYSVHTKWNAVPTSHQNTIAVRPHSPEWLVLHIPQPSPDKYSLPRYDRKLDFAAHAVPA